MKKVIKSMYGQVGLLKGYCPKCKAYAFIIDGILQCCDFPIKEIPKIQKIKREIEGEYKRTHIPIQIKKKILEKQQNKCIYCDCDLDVLCISNGKIRKINVNFDHFISWNYSRNNDIGNLFACCDICNEIKSDLYFPTIEEAKIYVLNKRKKLMSR